MSRLGLIITVLSVSSGTDQVKSEDISITSTSIKDIHYYLYTRANPKIKEELFVDDTQNLSNSRFVKNAPLVMLTHGFTNSGNISNEFIYPLKDVYLNTTKVDINIVTVDWSKLAHGPNYAQAAKNVQVVAKQTAKLIEFFVKQNVTKLENVHLVAHSLGAHVMGNTGHHVYKALGHKVARISGLDPAKPLFANYNDSMRLDPSDGDFVQVIHTAGATFGLFRRLGHIDFYPNGGLHQPNCTGITLTSCDHAKAHQYFIESVTNPRGFRSCKCTDKAIVRHPLKQFRQEYCSCNGTDAMEYMGQGVSESARGIYFLKTNLRSPFAQR